MTFEEKLEKAEEISEKLRNPETQLEEAVSLYEEGMKITKELDDRLSKLERRVEIVTSPAGDENGLITEPYSI